jgi:peptidoglycan/LPS O-acetylase OafA/YrhL
MFYLKHGNLDGLWRGPRGVVDYLQANWWGGHRQGGIRDVFRDTPYGNKIRASVIDGSLWTLAYEITCYLIVAVLAVVGVLRRARWLVLLFAVFIFGVLCWNQYAQLRFGLQPVSSRGYLPELPLLGTLGKLWFLRYGFMFLVGGVAELYSHRIPMNDLLGALSLAVIGWFAFNGELFGPALLAYEYAILYLAIRLPRLLQRVGQRNDYSYGVYIYSFVVQQALARFGVQVLGFLGYFAASAALSLGLAFVSWHLVEKQALKLKDWQPRLRRVATTATRPGRRTQEVPVPTEGVPTTSPTRRPLSPRRLPEFGSTGMVVGFVGRPRTWRATRCFVATAR